jgi:hypothetical protein
MAYFQKRLFDQAISDANTAIALNPSSDALIDLYVDRGITYNGKGHLRPGDHRRTWAVALGFTNDIVYHVAPMPMKRRASIVKQSPITMRR